MTKGRTKRLFLVILIISSIFYSFAWAETVPRHQQPLYQARAVKQTILRAEKDKESAIVGQVNENEKVEILEMDIVWLRVRSKDGEEGFLNRERIHDAQPIDPVNTPPYGMDKFAYIGKTVKTTKIHHEKSTSSESYVTLEPGARIAILDIENGWGRVIYWRNYAYVDMRNIGDIAPVSSTDVPFSAQTPIAAYTSYYSVATNESNLGRMVNIDVACEKISTVIAPDEVFDLNQVLGPYSKASGYEPAPILTGGTTTLGYGGGTCQVSSTFYNVALQLPGVEIIQRRPHGPGGAKYLPHGVDAAVGNENINLVVKNSYDFPIRVEASAQDGALYIVVWKEA